MVFVISKLAGRFCLWAQRERGEVPVKKRKIPNMPRIFGGFKGTSLKIVCSFKFQVNNIIFLLS